MPSLRAPLAFVLTMRSIQDEHDSRHVRIAEALDLVVACFLLNRIFAAAMMCAVNSPSRSCRTSFLLPHRIESKVRQWRPTRRKVQKTGQRLRHTSGSFPKARPKCLSRKRKGIWTKLKCPGVLFSVQRGSHSYKLLLIEASKSNHHTRVKPQPWRLRSP